MTRVPDQHGGPNASPRGLLPPVTSHEPIDARGRHLVRVDQLGECRVAEVRTGEHGVLAVGVLDDDTPFAVSNVCRHQFAKLGRGRVTPEGCLQCPWHRAEFDVSDGTMVTGPRGRIFGIKPYSATVRAIANELTLTTYPVELRDGAIWLRDTA